MYDLEQTRELVKAAVERTPHRRNPLSDYNTCEYTSSSGRAHCIAGQVMKDVGIDPPRYGNTYPFSSLWNGNVSGEMGVRQQQLRDTFTKEALRYLADAQVVFDNNGKPLPWKRAWEKLNAA